MSEQNETAYKLIYVDQDIYHGSCVFVVKLYYNIDLTGTSRMKPQKVEAEIADELLKMKFIKEYKPPTKEEEREHQARETLRYEELTRAELIRLASKRKFDSEKEGVPLTKLTKADLVKWHKKYEKETEDWHN